VQHSSACKRRCELKLTRKCAKKQQAHLIQLLEYFVHYFYIYSFFVALTMVSCVGVQEWWQSSGLTTSTLEIEDLNNSSNLTLSLSLCTPSAASARRWYFLQMCD
jgi:hypothetical protein